LRDRIYGFADFFEILHTAVSEEDWISMLSLAGEMIKTRLKAPNIE
jgi:hypothetical protein